MKDQEKLIKLYENASLNILSMIQHSNDSMNNRRKMELLKQVGDMLEKLQADSGSLITSTIEKAYKTGSSETVKQLRIQGVKNIDASFKASIHKEAVQNIVDEAFYNILEATEYMAEDVKKRLESIIQKANASSLVEGASRKEATKKAVAEATEAGISGIITKSGAQVPVDKYLAGSIAYHQRKAHVDGSINRMIANDQDLIYVNSVGITCSICAQYQGRVYSLSGKDKRFPPLLQRPPYHSHCVHSAYPWNEDFHDPDEVDKMLKESNRPFEDNRSESNIRRYNEIQKEKSRKNETRKQWLKYKSRMPDEIPDLKTFASQKARKTGKYKDWMDDYRHLGKKIGPLPKIKPIKVTPKKPPVDLEEIAKKKEKAAKAKARRQARKEKAKMQQIDLTKYKYIDTSNQNVAESERYIKMGLTRDQQASLRRYTGADYSEINTYLRKNKAPPEGVKTTIDNIQESFKKAPKLTENIIVTRRVDMEAIGFMFDEETSKKVSTVIKDGRFKDSIPDQDLKDIEKRIVNGKIGDKAFMSTSYAKDIFMKSGIELQIHLPEGYNNGIFIESISQYSREKEYLLSPGQQFRIVEIAMDGLGKMDGSRLVLKVIPT